LKRAWQMTAAAFAVLFVAWAQQSWNLSLTDALGPGPGFFPFWLALIGTALAIALIVRLQRQSQVEDTTPVSILPRGPAVRPVVTLLGALIGVAMLLEPLGFRICIAAFCLIVLPAIGARNWLVIVTFALVSSFGIYALFSDLLKVPLPFGLLGI
jgi:putative tricarboxylic transport membrane protein